MASQVLSGSSNVSYTNNTGQNVRIVINYMYGLTSVGSATITLNWAGVSVSAPFFAIGRNLATSGPVNTANNGLASTNISSALPTELMLAPGQTFSAQCLQYNIVVIPEAG
jgi:hypothetical protein